MSASLSDKELKEMGNHYFTNRNFTRAIESYTSAIHLNGSIAHYYTNRALCYLSLKKWDLAISDAETALGLDPHFVKAHFYKGRGSIELGNFEEAIRHLEKACKLSKEQNLNFGDDIICLLRTARKKRWQFNEEKTIRQELDLQDRLNDLIHANQEIRIQELQKKQNSIDILEQVRQIEKETEDNINELSALFSKINDKRQKREIPEYLCSKISFELYKDPVVTPSGMTYDRKDIEEHLSRIGHFDPITRQKLTIDQLVPNYAMREVLDSFIKDNEWALNE